MIVIWTAHSVHSKWCWRKPVADRDGKLIPSRVKNLDTRHVPLHYSEYHTDVVDDRHAILRAVERIAGLPISGLISNSYEDRPPHSLPTCRTSECVACPRITMCDSSSTAPLPDTTAELLIDGFIKLGAKLLLVLSENSIGREWIEGNVIKALKEERKRGQIVLVPLRVNDAVMDTNGAWAAKLRAQRHIGDFRHWEDHIGYR